MHNNYNYQSAAESYKQLQDIAIGDEVLIRVYAERFPMGTLKMLHTQHRGPNKVLKRIGFIAYELDIPHEESAQYSASRTSLVITLPRGHNDFQFVNCNHPC